MPSESEERAAHQKQLEEDFVGLDKETDGNSKTKRRRDSYYHNLGERA
jgi:hypothetical protein